MRVLPDGSGEQGKALHEALHYNKNSGIGYKLLCMQAAAAHIHGARDNGGVGAEAVQRDHGSALGHAGADDGDADVGIRGQKRRQSASST